MKRLGILLVGLPRMLTDLITAVAAGEPDMHVVGVLQDDDQVERALKATGARFIIVGLANRELPEHLVPLLVRHPASTLLGISEEGRRSFLYELRPHAIPVGEMSTQLLLELVRTRAEAADVNSQTSILRRLTRR